MCIPSVLEVTVEPKELLARWMASAGPMIREKEKTHRNRLDNEHGDGFSNSRHSN